MLYLVFQLDVYAKMDILMKLHWENLKVTVRLAYLNAKNVGI
jgi:hypothetical protein